MYGPASAPVPVPGEGVVEDRLTAAPVPVFQEEAVQPQGIAEGPDKQLRSSEETNVHPAEVFQLSLLPPPQSSAAAAASQSQSSASSAAAAPLHPQSQSTMAAEAPKPQLQFTSPPTPNAPRQSPKQRPESELLVQPELDSFQPPAAFSI